MNRRNFIRTSGLATLAAMTGRTMYASIPPTQRFSLSDASSTLLDDVQLYNTTVMQSFGFDNVNQCILTVQIVEAGLQLNGETEPQDATYRNEHGDLCVTKLSLTGSKLGHMYLKGFGHGISIGVEAAGTVTYLWVECDAPVVSGHDGFGSHIARIKFVNGATYDSSDVGTSAVPGSSKYAIVPGSIRNWPSYDPVNDHIMLHYVTGNGAYYAVYNVADIKAGTATQLATPITPPANPQGGSGAGVTLYANYGYFLSGDRYAQCPHTSGDTGNIYITIVDMNDGNIVASALTQMAPNLLYREPEGMAIQIPDPANPSYLRLCSGIASLRSCSTTAKYMHIGYKDVLI